MSAPHFDEKGWEERFASALKELAETQQSYLEEYWQTHGSPTQFTFNGHDETPFPRDDLYDLYEIARNAVGFENADHYEPLQKALALVRGNLRSHPTLTRALGPMFANENLQVGILNSSSWTSLNHLIIGQMAQRASRSDKGFCESAAELNSLLLLAGGKRHAQLANDLNLGYDIALFHGIAVRDRIDLGEGYALVPYMQLSAFIDDSLLEDIAPNQIRHRQWQSVFGIVHSFRWKPELRRHNSLQDNPIRMPPPLFGRWASEFVNLLGVLLGKPMNWMTTIDGCVSETTCDLLGITYGSGSSRKGRSVGHLFDPFKKVEFADTIVIENARRHFANRGDTAYPELAPIIQRLAEALARDGRFASQDRVLDVAVALERLFKPTGRRISNELQVAIANLLGSNAEIREEIKLAVKHFYDVRSAIIHGPMDKKKELLLTEVVVAFRNGFDLARDSVARKLEKSTKSS